MVAALELQEHSDKSEIETVLKRVHAIMSVFCDKSAACDAFTANYSDCIQQTTDGKLFLEPSSPN